MTKCIVVTTAIVAIAGPSPGGADVGIDWVHTDCGATPSPDKPDGWVREINKDGNVGDNMEAKQDFCSLWPN
jgi:hypothetical protein